jgi:hypothetical protein
VAVLAVQDPLARDVLQPAQVLWPVVKLQTAGTSPRSHSVALPGGCATDS